MARAQEDPAFRERLVLDPKAALEEEFEVSLPARFQVDVVQERPDRLCIVLPVDLSGMSDRAARAMAGRPIVVEDNPVSPWG